MMPYNHLVDEVKASGVLTGISIAICAYKLDLRTAILMYSLCVVLLALSLGGGVYFARRRKAEKAFYQWGVTTLLLSALLLAFMSFSFVAILGGAVTWAVGVATWCVMIGGAFWLIFIYKVDRTPRAVNIQAISLSGAFGTLFAGTVLSMFKNPMIVCGLLLSSMVGFVMVGLLSSYLRGLMYGDFDLKRP